MELIDAFVLTLKLVAVISPLLFYVLFVLISLSRVFYDLYGELELLDSLFTAFFLTITFSVTGIAVGTFSIFAYTNLF